MLGRLLAVAAIVVGAAACAAGTGSSSPDASVTAAASPISSVAPSPSAGPSASVAPFSFGPFAGLTYTMTLPRGWVGAASVEDWPKAIAAYDMRYPGDLPADNPLRDPPPTLFGDADEFVALSKDGSALLVNVSPAIGTPDEALRKLEAMDADAFARLLFPSPPPDLEAEVRRLDLPAGPAAAFTTSWTDTDGTVHHMIRYYIPTTDRAYLLTADFLDANALVVLPAVTTMVQSFRLTGG